MPRPKVSVTIIAKNEEASIRRAIDSVRWADEVLVVDSGSTDQTVALATAAGARVISHSWEGYGQQKNYAQGQAQNDWVLNLDADEALTDASTREIQAALENPGEARAFAFPRKTYYLGRWIRHGGWYPNVLVRLADRRHARWTEPAVHEALVTDGPVMKLQEPIEHHAFGSIRDQVATNVQFSWLGSQDLRRRGVSSGLLKVCLKPIGKFFETFILKAGFRDGLPGFLISVNAAYSIFLKYAYLLEDRIRDR